MDPTETNFPLEPVDIDNLAHDGRGVGRLANGQVCFVPYVLPGERVELKHIRIQKKVASALPATLMQSHPERIEPHCGHFGDCGGCDWQHMPYPMQLTWKQQLLIDIFKRYADIKISPQIQPGPAPFKYRNRITLHLDPDNHSFGFQRKNSHDICPITSCELVAGDAISKLQALPRTIVDRLLKAAIQRLEVRMLDDTRYLLLGKPKSRHSIIDETLCQELVEKSGATGCQLGNHSAGDTEFTYDIDGLELRAGPFCFVQTNLGLNQLLVDHVVQTIPTATEIVDLYAGIGNFSIPLAAVGHTVHAVEIHKEAVAYLAKNAASNQLESRVFEYQSASDKVPHLLTPERTVVLDPPRTGAKTVVPQLIAGQPSNIVYVSCNAMTLARDVRQLCQSGYRIENIDGFDMFPQTAHLETVVHLSNAYQNRTT